jgi:hypothetical protein
MGMRQRELKPTAGFALAVVVVARLPYSDRAAGWPRVFIQGTPNFGKKVDRQDLLIEPSLLMLNCI